MITQFKIFEKVHIYDEYVDKFFSEYEKVEKYYYNNSLEYAKNYYLPSLFYDDFSLMRYFYVRRKEYDKPIENYIKKRVKEYAINSILKKIDDNIELAFKLKDVLDEIKLNNVWNSDIKNTFYLFKAAIKKVGVFTDIDKYNI